MNEPFIYVFEKIASSRKMWGEVHHIPAKAYVEFGSEPALPVNLLFVFTDKESSNTHKIDVTGDPILVCFGGDENFGGCLTIVPNEGQRSLVVEQLNGLFCYVIPTDKEPKRLSPSLRELLPEGYKVL